MTPLYEQPMRKLLGILSPTISWLDEKGPVDVSDVPTDHLEAIKQLERIGIVHKRNNRCYELQKIRLKKLMGTLGIEVLVAPSPVVPAPVAPTQVLEPPIAPTQVLEPPRGFEPPVNSDLN